jgi:hypothetical protein
MPVDGAGVPVVVRSKGSDGLAVALDDEPVGKVAQPYLLRRTAEAGDQQPRDLSSVRDRSRPHRDPRVRWAILRRSVQHERVLGVLELRAATQRELAAGGRAAGDDQQDRAVPALGADRERGVEQRRSDPAAPAVGVDHPGQLDRRRCVDIQAEKPRQAVLSPPQEVLYVPARAVAQPAPLQLQPPAIGGYDAPLELGHRAQCGVRQAACELQHQWRTLEVASSSGLGIDTKTVVT